MRNTAAHNTPAQAAILTQPVEWPWPITAFYTWRDDADALSDAERMDMIGCATCYWFRVDR